jgi:hypothetical protein
VPGPIGVVAHYNLLEPLEPSGPGDLFRARDTKRGRTVTLRWLPAEFTPDAAAGLINDGTQVLGDVSYLDRFPYLNHPVSGYDSVPLSVG